MNQSLTAKGSWTTRIRLLLGLRKSGCKRCSRPLDAPPRWWTRLIERRWPLCLRRTLNCELRNKDYQLRCERTWNDAELANLRAKVAAALEDLNLVDIHTRDRGADRAVTLWLSNQVLVDEKYRGLMADTLADRLRREILAIRRD
jgi:hypothetical protein